MKTKAVALIIFAGLASVSGTAAGIVESIPWDPADIIVNYPKLKCHATMHVNCNIDEPQCGILRELPGPTMTIDLADLSITNWMGGSLAPVSIRSSTISESGLGGQIVLEAGASTITISFLDPGDSSKAVRFSQTLNERGQERWRQTWFGMCGRD